jgi:hypothetical protein
VPLDSITAGKLRESDEGTELPVWSGVGALTPAVSAQYQAVAAQIARALKMRTVHLDVFWWSDDRDTKPDAAQQAVAAAEPQALVPLLN